MGLRNSIGKRLPVPKRVERTLDAALDRALDVQRPAVLLYVERARRRDPSATPAQLLTKLERRYLAAVVGTGAASGGTAALPGVGTAASVATAAAEITAFVSATAMYVLAVAEVHGVPTDDPQVRRAMVLTILLGDVGAAALSGEAIEPKHWARVIGHTGSKDAARGLNNRLTKLFVTRFGAKQTALLAGRAVPFGIGAGVGAAGNAALGKGVVRSARRAFGPAPSTFPPLVVDAPAGVSDPARSSG